MFNLLLLLFLVSFGSPSPVGDSIREAVSYMGAEQSIGVRGRLKCGNTYLADTRVKLWDEDSGPGDPDDLIGETMTNATGHFQVSGTQKEMTSIDPVLRFYHNCNKKGSCKRKVTFVIPDSYINKGKKVTKWFDFGTLNMEIITKGESIYCFD